MHPEALDEARLLALADVRRLEAAQDYWMLGRVGARLRWRDRIAGRVDGAHDRYRVEARLAAGSAETRCSCGRRQPCRHALALLWAWSREPESFADLEALAAPWQGAPPGELGELLWRLLQAPEDPLAVLLEAGEGRGWEAQPPAGRLRHLESFLAEKPGEAGARFEELSDSLAPRPGEGEEGRRQRVRREGELAGRFLELPEEIRSRLDPAAWGRLVARWLDELEAGAAPVDGPELRLLARLLAAPQLPEGLYARLLRAVARLDGRGVVDRLLRAASEEAEAERRLGLEEARERRERAVLALADLLALRGRGEEAERVMEEAAGLPAVGERWVEARLERGDLEGAVAAARRALAGATGAAVRAWRSRLAELLEAAGRSGEAFALRVANYAEKADSGGYRCLRRAARQRGAWAEMAGAARAALRQQEGRASVLEALLEEDDPAALAEELGSALEDPDTPVELILRAIVRLGRERPGEAQGLGRRLLRSGRASVQQRARLARFLARLRVDAVEERGGRAGGRPSGER
ncbi:MAG: SWIM zinc finger domain-containing protein [Bacillota bacterium]|nr:SWIM zinc finger domain-containing protein [Bacillota bacterium]